MSRDGVVVPLGRQRRVGREVKSCGVPDDGVRGNGGGGDGFTSLGCFGDGVGECTGHITQHFLRARRQNPRRREEGDAATSFAAAARGQAAATLQRVTVSKTAATSKTDKTFSGGGREEGKERRKNTTVRRRVVRRVAGRRRRRARPAPLPPVDLKRNCSSLSLAASLVSLSLSPSLSHQLRRIEIR